MSHLATEPVPSVGDRLGWLRRNSRRWLFALVLLVVAVLIGSTWSLGLFSSESANPRNVVSAGSMSQVSTADNTAFMTAVDMVPGAHVHGEVTIGNVGDASGDFTLKVKDVKDVPGPRGGRLSKRLVLKVYDTDRHRPVYVGPLRWLNVRLGTWTPGEERTYEFRVRLPNQHPSVDNAYQGSSVTATFEWYAVQSQ